MRSALICVFFVLSVHREQSLAADEDFRPTPIPLTEWNGGSKDNGAGTLHEALATDAPPAVAAVPAHYWEDALRHSVYLTLVRDKIDQLIAKDSASSSKTKPDQQPVKDVDDHNLWEKIKTAPFDRLHAEEPSSLGDIAIMAKGRLLEENEGFRFTEDKPTKEKCNDDKCKENVKAFWSVKRVRQRDAETIPGKYHYELTFSVISQSPKKTLHPHEFPMRTFTVREGTPVEKPQYRTHSPTTYSARPQRAIWFHKNIVPHHQNQRPEQGLDRFFSSLFTSDESSHIQPYKRYKPVSYAPHGQRSKIGYVGHPSEQHHQRQISPYNYKPHSTKLSRPPLGPPPLSHSQHHYSELDTTRHHNQYIPQTEYKHLSSNVVKTTRPAVLPTPPGSYAPSTNTTEEMVSNLNTTVSPPRDADMVAAFTTYTKGKPVPTKVSYFPEHVRPPVFNAPPGVFVTMDKKPFKPLPPIKYGHPTKQTKHKPIDFRPSPQLNDVQISDPHQLTDVFRPINLNYENNGTSIEPIELTNSSHFKHIRKTKPKKHDNVKVQRTTTSVPDIITAYNVAIDNLDWANILGALTKTTSMMSERTNYTEETTPIPSTTVSVTTTVQARPNITEFEKISITTTSKPKRTRPPPKFTKPAKVKKHKRVNSTTTTLSNTSTEMSLSGNTFPDSTPQASSSAHNSTKSEWQPNNKLDITITSATPITVDVTNLTFTTTAEPSTTKATTTKAISTTHRTTTTTQTQQTTTKQKISTTTEVHSLTGQNEEIMATIQPRNKNRFRQSTLMIKGTSVKHDKWSSPNMERNKTIEKTKFVPQANSKVPLRRKGSNFHGYVTSTTKSVEEEQNREGHEDRIPNHNLSVLRLISTSVPSTETISSTTPTSTQVVTEESVYQKEQSETESSSATGDFDDVENHEEDAEEEENEDSEEEDSNDHDEYIFTNSSIVNNEKSDTSNEVESEIVTTTEEPIITSPHSVVKNKTKCKNKKNYNQNTNLEVPKHDQDVGSMAVRPIEPTDTFSTSTFVDDIMSLAESQHTPIINQTDSKYVDNDDDLEEFLKSINEKKDSSESIDFEYQDDEKESKDSSTENDDDIHQSQGDDSFRDYREHPFSFLELMAME